MRQEYWAKALAALKQSVLYHNADDVRNAEYYLHLALLYGRLSEAYPAE